MEVAGCYEVLTPVC